MHARPSHRIVRLAARFESTIELVCESRRCDTRHMLEVLAFGAWLAEHGSPPFEIVADGPDEAAAVDAMVVLIEERFGEG
ncbi:MAG: HPr family phosphocarrier protein [Ectothiorhodospiraceae bacterium]|nr:HPr family phosphocarrier protein [Chromatiales bacterium]MCP5156760.1 HPr family phosphocarrier protein [Ectothiorhodospiraceae bacterium]